MSAAVMASKEKHTTTRRTPLRVLVIGAGPAAVDMHLPVLARLRDKREVELALVCDLQPERAGAARRRFGFGAQTGEGMPALARPDVDAVYVFGSAQLHFEYGLAALRAGKHLFVEKPIAPSYEAAVELARAAKQRGLIAVGGHNRRFFESFARARALAGRSGWRFAEAVFHKPELGRPAAFGAQSWLAANGIHALDALVFMMNGLPEQITALAGQANGAPPSAFAAIMRWHDGAQGVFLCNNDAGARREEYAFHGLGESCRIDDAGMLYEKGYSRVQAPARSRSDSIAAEHDAFLQAIRGGGEPVHALASIAPSLFLCELIERGFSGAVHLPEAGFACRPAPASAAPSILVVEPRELQPALARWLPAARLVCDVDVQASDAQRTDIAAVILGRGAAPLTPQLWAKLPCVRTVGVVGLSVARHDPEALLARGITVLNATQSYAESVAEFALALAILARRRAFASHELMRGGGWGTLPPARLAGIARRLRPIARAMRIEPLLLRLWRARRGGVQHAAAAVPQQPRELRGAAVALIGWSANARAFAERLLRAGTRVLVHSEHATDLDLHRSGVTRVSLAEALAADIVSLHRGLTPATRHFLGAPELEKLRPGAVLINIARGALIEPGALLARLQRGDVFACLDTFEAEPPATADPLRRLPNVFLTSHIAGGSSDMHAAAAHEVVRKVADCLAGVAVEAISADRLRMMT
jgi:phosphoglycerate dehydrogenase-like enzyme/predicted dehydrogenase